MTRWFWICSLALGVLGTARGDLSPSEVLVVHNTRVPAGRGVAEHYAKVRGIPADRIVGVTCSEAGQITHEEYQRDIVRPLDEYLRGKGWVKRQRAQLYLNGSDSPVDAAVQCDVKAIVLVYGIPRQIAHDPARANANLTAQFQTTAAALESELTMFTALGVNPSGLVPNPAFREGFGKFEGKTWPFLIVTRLDGPTPEIVHERIDDAVAAEKSGLVGNACFDVRSIKELGYVAGDQWIEEGMKQARNYGLPVLVDRKPDVAGVEALWSSVALYFGWYATSVSGAVAAPGFRFERGAVAYHIHSFSGIDLRSTTVAWTGPLVARGAVATMGCVEEPYLSYTPHVGVLVERLLAGDQWGEAAYTSQPSLSWMVQIVGDPLYRPFPRRAEGWIKGGLARTDATRPWFVGLSLNRQAAAENAAAAAAQARALWATEKDAVALEAIADALGNAGDAAGAARAFQQASDQARTRTDAWRNGLKAALALADARQRAESWKVMERLWRATDGRPEQAAVLQVAKLLRPMPMMNPAPEFWQRILDAPPAPVAPPSGAGGPIPPSVNKPAVR